MGVQQEPSTTAPGLGDLFRHVGMHGAATPRCLWVGFTRHSRCRNEMIDQDTCVRQLGDLFSFFDQRQVTNDPKTSEK